MKLLLSMIKIESFEREEKKGAFVVLCFSEWEERNGENYYTGPCEDILVHPIHSCRL